MRRELTILLGLLLFLSIGLVGLLQAEIGTSSIVFLAVALAVGLAAYYLTTIPAQRARQRALLELAQLRTEGVEIRNRGSRGLSDEDRLRWYEEVDAWERQVLRTAERLSPIEAESLRTLDTFEVRPYAELDDPRAIHRVSMLSATLQRLDLLIQRQLSK